MNISLRTELTKLQKEFKSLVATTDEDDEYGIEDIGILEDRIERLIERIESES